MIPGFRPTSGAFSPPENHRGLTGWVSKTQINDIWMRMIEYAQILCFFENFVVLRIPIGVIAFKNWSDLAGDEFQTPLQDRDSQCWQIFFDY